jgi:hypothetical protein
VARQAQQICRGTRRLNAGDGAVLWHRPGFPGQGIMTELIPAPRKRPNCRWILVSQGSGAHSGIDVELLQTPAAQETADNGVELSAEAPPLMTGIRSANHSHGVRARHGRHPPGPAAPMARGRPRAHRPEKMPPPRLISPVSALSATLPSAGSNESTVQAESRSRVGDASAEVPPPVPGVTAPDLPEGI